MNANSLLNVVIVGTGVGVRTHYTAFRRIPGVRVLAILGRSYERTVEIAKQFDLPMTFGSLDEVCSHGDIGLIVIASPTTFHLEHVARVIRAGIPVLAEKPLGINLGEVIKLIGLQRETGSIALVNHQLRFNPFIVKIRSMLDEGLLGRIYHVRMHQQSSAFASASAKWNWSFERKSGGGIRLAMASHLIDLFRFLFPGNEFDEFQSSLDPVLQSRSGPDGEARPAEVSSFFSMGGVSTKGIQFSLSATASAAFPAEFSLSLFGDKGQIEFDLNKWLRFATTANPGQVTQIDVSDWRIDDSDKKMSFFALSFLHLAPIICKAIIRNDPTILNGVASLNDALETQRILDKMLISAKRPPHYEQII